MRGVGGNSASQSEEEMELRRGPWTMDEDLILVNYISTHGEGRWNALASCAGLKRTGKSCRLRWLNYLRPDVRRGNITPEEQLLILELHSRWGNRWSKIAQHLPGRTDNEIKNYWRTRVQKHAKQLQCDVNSKQFKDAMKYLWIPRLVERIRVANSGVGQTTALPLRQHPVGPLEYAEASSHMAYPNPTPENSANAHASEADPASAPALDFNSYYNLRPSYHSTDDLQLGQIVYPEYQITPPMFCNQDLTLGGEFFAGDASENVWSVEDMWFWQQQMCDGV